MCTEQALPGDFIATTHLTNPWNQAIQNSLLPRAFFFCPPNPDLSLAFPTPTRRLRTPVPSPHHTFPA